MIGVLLLMHGSKLSNVCENIAAHTCDHCSTQSGYVSNAYIGDVGIEQV